jgi:5-oxoprolinase (ATP-hydrolysing) subunit C
MIEVLTDTALATVQDLGRAGGLGWGVGTAGAMDDLALQAGNILLGNPVNAAAIEVQVFPFAVRFECVCNVAVTGADCAADLDGSNIPPWWAARASAGSVLRLAPPKGGSWRASRAYLCVAGGLAVPVVLGSRSTQLRGSFGGHEGRPLRRGDRLSLGNPSPPQRTECIGTVPPALALPLLCDGLPAVRVIPAAEYDRYTEVSRSALWQAPWRITAQSDRYGFRLAGPTLEPVAPIELRSHGIVPGVIQVPHGGQPIVQMRDAQPSGGYPKIGTIIESDLWRLAQAPIGSQVRFIQCGWDDAVAAGEEVAHYLAELQRLVGLHDLLAAAA